MVETLATWKTTLMNDLQVLTQLRGSDDMSLMRHAMKEQDMGFHCYQAGKTSQMLNWRSSKGAASLRTALACL